MGNKEKRYALVDKETGEVVRESSYKDSMAKRIALYVAGAVVGAVVFYAVLFISELVLEFISRVYILKLILFLGTETDWMQIVLAPLLSVSVGAEACKKICGSVVPTAVLIGTVYVVSLAILIAFGTVSLPNVISVVIVAASAIVVVLADRDTRKR